MDIRKIFLAFVAVITTLNICTAIKQIQSEQTNRELNEFQIDTKSKYHKAKAKLDEAEARYEAADAKSKREDAKKMN